MDSEATQNGTIYLRSHFPLRIPWSDSELFSNAMRQNASSTFEINQQRVNQSASFSGWWVCASTIHSVRNSQRTTLGAVKWNTTRCRQYWKMAVTHIAKSLWNTSPSVIRLPESWGQFGRDIDQQFSMKLLTVDYYYSYYYKVWSFLCYTWRCV